jgi:phosphosulfolactate phosphohydrolase-like enzyme
VSAEDIKLARFVVTTNLGLILIILSLAIALMIYDQSEFDLRCEWGAQGVSQLAPISDVIVIVAEMALVTFQAFQQNLLGYLEKCSSGKELIEKGFESDVELSAAFNISDCVPLFGDNAYSKRQG